MGRLIMCRFECHFHILFSMGIKRKGNFPVALKFQDIHPLGTIFIYLALKFVLIGLLLSRLLIDELKHLKNKKEVEGFIPLREGLIERGKPSKRFEKG